MGKFGYTEVEYNRYLQRISRLIEDYGNKDKRFSEAISEGSIVDGLDNGEEILEIIKNI